MESKAALKKRRNRAPEPKSDKMLVRLQPAEKEAFQDAADLVGLSLSDWVRTRLRRIAMRELEAASQPIAFIKEVEPGQNND